MAKANPAHKKSILKAEKAIRQGLQMGRLHFEKCELKEAKAAFKQALRIAQREKNISATMEALSNLLRLAFELQNKKDFEELSAKLDSLMAAHARHIPAMAWNCKAAIARYHDQLKLAQKYTRFYLHAVRKHPQLSLTDISRDEALIKGWLMLGIILWQRGRYGRARWIADEILRRYQAQNFRNVNGLTYLLLANISEKEGRLEHALSWLQKAQRSFLEEQNWYYHLYVLFGYARISRAQKNYEGAYLYLDMLEKSTTKGEFGALKKEIAAEHTRLKESAVDLVIDSRQGFIKTRENAEISLRKQYILLDILAALSRAHEREGDDNERALSKAEIIEKVWKESYRPEAHDNKLYYNINRLRKLIEPDVRNPQYLLNWKEGYRLAPGLKVHFVGTTNGDNTKEGSGDER